MKTQMTRQHTRVAQLPVGAHAWIVRPIAPFLFLWALALLCLASATPASAQSGVLPSARQAGTVSGHPPAGLQPTGVQTCDPSALFCNFPEDGYTDAWTINYGYSVTNEIQLPKALSGQSKAHITGFEFTVWTIPDYIDALESVSWGLGSTEFGTDYGRGAGCASCGTVIQPGFAFLNEYGYAVWTIQVTGLNTDIPLSQSQKTSVWFTLHDANVYTAYKTNSPVYWDQNCSPVACNGVLASDQNPPGTTPGGESFELLGAIQ
ncbi:MAG: hypothetical protein WA655_00235 [Candidatus Korobacteraceae bacterium]